MNTTTNECKSCCSCGQQDDSSKRKQYITLGISLAMLFIGIALDHFFSEMFTGYLRLGWYLIAYIPVALPVFKEAYETIKEKDFFTEFSLMSIATIGAFVIKEYPEGVAVMVFYTIGELFQDAAVDRSKRNIKSLLDVRPDVASVYRDGKYISESPAKVLIGETIQVKAGEKTPLDGELVSASGSFNTSALTGESKPKTIREGEIVLAGMLNIDKVIEVKVTKEYKDSTLSRILDMVQDATSRKAKTELLIRRFARIYTPAVFVLAVLITVVPALFVDNYVFSDWLSRALVFLVISCPCALVVSIPLGYFGGIGAASKAGILFKGANYLDLMTKVNTVVMDKTGTLTKGVFNVQKLETSGGFNKDELLALTVAIERFSTHPIAKAIVGFAKESPLAYEAKDVKELAGYGMEGIINGDGVLVGNTKLLRKFNIDYDQAIDNIVETIVVIAVNRQYTGYITIADEIKDDAAKAISAMHTLGIKEVIMLSGDKSSITHAVANQLGIDQSFGDLLPADKVSHLEKLKADPNNVVAFVGDGINDAPSLALSDVGIAMGGMGSDAAIEIADVIIQTDEPSKIAAAIKIAKSTRSIVIQNITFTFIVKLIVLVLGGFGLANMWEAVFADVGVSLLAILNAVRILRTKFIV